MADKICIIIGGPTASGKTALAIQLALTYATEIISADSRQCFRELNIGVAKPDASQLAAVKHHFINSHSVWEAVDAAVFEACAMQALERIFSRSDYAIVVGGTGLYSKALMEGFDPIPEVPPGIREEIVATYAQNGLDWLKARVAEEDPVYYASGEIDNPQRLMRALEVVRASGKSIRVYQQAAKKKRPFLCVPVRIAIPRHELYQRIDQRTDDMIRNGLVEEVRQLMPYRQLNPLKTVGYREIFSCLDGDISLEKATQLIKTHTRNYAKRQETWFRKYLDARSFLPSEFEQILEYVGKHAEENG